MEISLSQGKRAIIDSEDYEKIKGFSWCYSGNGYAQAHGRIEGEKIITPLGNSIIAKIRRPKKGKRFLIGTAVYLKSQKEKTVLMHRFIINAPKDMEIDHINGNGLDNRKSNLRICTRSQNAANHKLLSSNKSGYTGVHYANTEKRRKRWVASLRANGKKKIIGRFYTREEAAIVYNEAAIKYHGKFARLNLIPLTDKNKVVTLNTPR